MAHQKQEVEDDVPVAVQTAWIRFFLMPCLFFACFFFATNSFANDSTVKIQAVEPSECFVVSLDPQPAWVSDAVWLESTSRESKLLDEKDELLLVDAANSTVNLYSVNRNGARGRKVSLASELGGREFYPSIVRKTPKSKEILIESEDGLILKVKMSDNHHFEVIEAFDLLAEAKSSYGELKSIYRWTPLVDEKILAFGDIVNSKGEWSSALVRLSLDNPADFSVILEVSIDDPARQFYLLGYPYLASSKDNSFFLYMDNYPSLFTVSEGEVVSRGPGASQHALTDSIIRMRPNLPASEGLANVRGFFSAIEQKAMHAGLYVWRGDIYMLTRRPSQVSGKTVWQLEKVEHFGQGSTKRVFVHINANHLMVVPGDRYWAFIQKGPVEGLGEQKIESVTIVPVAAFEKTWSASGASDFGGICE